MADIESTTGGGELPMITPETEKLQLGSLEEGWSLCLSGGGYRAMLFHTGALWRLNELGYLPKLDRISSVSGGSITAAVLGVNWGELDFDPESGVARNFEQAVVRPVRKLAGKTIGRKAVLGGVLLPGTVGQRVTKAYRKRLFGRRTLQDLPDRPRFVINATNIQTGALRRFSKPYMGDYRVGRVFEPTVELAVAVAASSAFPPVLSPIVLELDPASFRADPKADLQRPPYTEKAVLSDGGVSTTSASRPPGSAPPRSWSAMPAARCSRRRRCGAGGYRLRVLDTGQDDLVKVVSLHPDGRLKEVRR